MLFTITFPCKMCKIFSFLIALSGIGVLLMGGLTAFYFWVTNKDILQLKKIYEKVNAKGESSRSREAGGELVENGGEKYHTFATFWSYAWPHVVDTVVMLIYALAFVLIFGTFMYSEKCGK